MDTVKTKARQQTEDAICDTLARIQLHASQARKILESNQPKRTYDVAEEVAMKIARELDGLASLRGRL